MLQDQRKDLERTNTERDRSEAVREFYENYINAYAKGIDSKGKIQALIVTTRMFRMKSAVRGPQMAPEINKFLRTVATKVDRADHGPAGYVNGYNGLVSYMIQIQEELFDELLIWGFHGKSRRFGKLMDRELAALQNE